MLIAGIGPGCSKPEADLHQLDRARELADAGRWDECIPVIKAYLLLAPSPPHFLHWAVYLYTSETGLPDIPTDDRFVHTSPHLQPM